MKLSLIQICLAMIFAGVCLARDGSAQDLLNRKVNISIENQEIKRVLSIIENEVNVKFTYRPNIIVTTHKVSLTVNDELLSTVLTRLLSPLKIKYKVVSNQIILSRSSFLSSETNIEPQNSITTKAEFEVVEQTVKGKVTDENGEGIPGASVTLEGTSRGTSSNKDGAYSITVNGPKSVLIFSFVGFLPEKVIVGNRKEINIKLTTDAKALEEVVVVGYGEIRKSDLTGSVTSVKVDDKMATQNVSMDKLLQGRAAGVEVISGNGAPGAAINVRIRGVGTLTGNSEPLYVVDGIIMNSGGEVRQASTNGNYSQETQNGLTALNPQDIETIEILKDASATAIYGSRGANGVVLVTTKRGKSGKTAVNFRVSTEISRVSKKIDVLSGPEFALFDNEYSIINKGTPRYPTTTSGLDSLKSIDWSDYSFRDAITQNYRLSFSGKVQNTSFYLASGFSDFQGTVKNTGLKKSDLRLNLIHDVNAKLKITSNSSLMYQVNNWTQGTERLGQANSSMIRSILRKVH